MTIQEIITGAETLHAEAEKLRAVAQSTAQNPTWIAAATAGLKNAISQLRIHHEATLPPVAQGASTAAPEPAKP